MPEDERNSSNDDEFPASLTENDKMTLSIIREEELTDFSFDGLRRRLGIHQQTLSRILDRLEDRGIIEKTPRGYTVTKKGRKRLETYLLNNNNNLVASPYFPLIQTLLPGDIGMPLLLSTLQSKWFGTLRWFGCSRKDYDDDDDDNEVTFKWLTEDGEIQVDAAFSSSSLSIEAKFLKENDTMMSDAIKAAHQLIDHIIRLYSRQQSGTKL